MILAHSVTILRVLVSEMHTNPKNARPAFFCTEDDVIPVH